MWAGVGIINQVENPIIELPSKDPRVPIRVIPPDIPLPIAFDAASLQENFPAILVIWLFSLFLIW